MPNNDFVPKIWSKYKKCVYYTKIYFLYCYWYNIIILRCSEYHCVIVIVLFYLRQFILPSTGCEDIHTANNVKTAGVNVAWWRRWFPLSRGGGWSGADEWDEGLTEGRRADDERGWTSSWRSISPILPPSQIQFTRNNANKTRRRNLLVCEWRKILWRTSTSVKLFWFFFSSWRRAGRDDKTRSVLQGLFCVLSKSSGDEAPSGKKMSVTTERR